MMRLIASLSPRAYSAANSGSNSCRSFCRKFSSSGLTMAHARSESGKRQHTITASSKLAQGLKRERSASKGKLSLHPLSLETALGAALQTGGVPDRKQKKAVDKRR